MTHPGMNKKGSALVLVLIFMVVLTVLGTAVMGIAVTENRMSIYQENKMQAYYLARSGAQSVAEYMITDPHNNAIKMLNHTSADVTPMDNGKFFVDVSNDPSSKSALIVATGTYRGVEQQVSVQVTYSSDGVGGIFDHAVVAQNGITSQGGGGNNITITGSVATKTGEIVISDGSNTITGGKVIDPDLYFPPVVEPDEDEDGVPDYDFIFDTINDSETFHSTSDDPLHIFAKNIELKNDSITVTGDGIVHLYVQESVLVDTNASFDISEDAKLYVYIIGQMDDPAEESTFVWKGSGEVSNVFVYAPNSAVNWNNADKKYVIIGALIGKTVFLANQITITHNPQMANDIELDKTGIGVTFTGYRWVE